MATGSYAPQTLRDDFNAEIAYYLEGGSKLPNQVKSPCMTFVLMSCDVV